MKALLNRLYLSLFARGIFLKLNNLVEDYSFSIKIENETIAEDGVKEYDIVIDQYIVPKSCAKILLLNNNL